MSCTSYRQQILRRPGYRWMFELMDTKAKVCPLDPQLYNFPQMYETSLKCKINHNCGWLLYIWGKFYTFVGIYTFEGPAMLCVLSSLMSTVVYHVHSMKCVSRWLPAVIMPSLILTGLNKVYTCRSRNTT